MVSERAFAGALERPLGSATLLTSVLLVLVATAVVRLGWLLPINNSGADILVCRNSRVSPGRQNVCPTPDMTRGRDEIRFGRLDLAVMALATFSAAALCGGLSLPPETSPMDLILVRVLFVAEESWAWFWILRKWSRYSPAGTAIPADAPVSDKETERPVGTGRHKMENVSSAIASSSVCFARGTIVP